MFAKIIQIIELYNDQKKQNILTMCDIEPRTNKINDMYKTLCDNCIDPTTNQNSWICFEKDLYDFYNRIQKINCDKSYDELLHKIDEYHEILKKN